MFVENGESPPRLSSAPEGRYVGQYGSQHAAPLELGRSGGMFFMAFYKHATPLGLKRFPN